MKQTEQTGALQRNAKIWLATISTVVGLATGMFTLRDQIFPSEGGSAAAISVPAYQQQVGRICDELNDNDRLRAHEDTTAKKRLAQATTTTQQRNALLDAVRRTTSRSEHALAAFTALQTPESLSATHRGTAAAWRRNLARLRTYALRLDRSTTLAQLRATIGYLSGLRPLLADDGVKYTSGLERLGAANCDLQSPRVTPTYTLPPLGKHGGGGSSANTPERQARPPRRSGPPAAPAQSVNTPESKSAPESVNTPQTKSAPQRVNTPETVAPKHSPAEGSPGGDSQGAPTTPDAGTTGGGTSEGGG